MKVMSILGSPHIEGNTATVLGWVEDELRAKGHEVERVDLINKDLGYCMACYACQANPDEPACVQKDEGNAFFKAMADSDMIVYSSPLYMWTFSAPVKTMFDRSLCLVTGYMTDNWKSLIDGKRTALVVTCAGPVENNADLIQEAYGRGMTYAKADDRGALVVPMCTTPDQMGDDVKARAAEFAGNICA